MLVTDWERTREDITLPHNSKNSKNMRKILSVVKQREVEYPEKLVYRSPFWYRVGLWKVDYSKKENSEL